MEQNKILRIKSPFIIVELVTIHSFFLVCGALAETKNCLHSNLERNEVRYSGLNSMPFAAGKVLCQPIHVPGFPALLS